MHKYLILLIFLVGACQSVSGSPDLDLEDTASEESFETDSDTFSEIEDTASEESFETDSDTFSEIEDTASDSLTSQEECGCPTEKFPLEKRKCTLEGSLVEQQPSYMCNQGVCVEVGIMEELETECEYGCGEVFSGSVYSQDLSTLLFQGTIRDCQCRDTPIDTCDAIGRVIITEHYDALTQECINSYQYDYGFCGIGTQCVEISETEIKCQVL